MNKELVILMSGGLDSYLAWYYAIKELGYSEKDILALHFDIGQPYAEKERKAIESFDFPVTTMKIDLLRPEFDNIPTTEDGGQIITARNMIFVTIASGFGKKIWLSALKGERHEFMKDKSKKFYKDVTELLTYVCSDERKQTIVETPFSEMTKSDLIKWALENGITVEQLRNTSTCYDGKVNRCGVCSTCVKRWIAFKNNGITEEYDSPPEKSSYAKEYAEKLLKAKEQEDYTHYCKERIETDLKVLGRVVL